MCTTVIRQVDRGVRTQFVTSGARTFWPNPHRKKYLSFHRAVSPTVCEQQALGHIDLAGRYTIVPNNCSGGWYQRVVKIFTFFTLDQKKKYSSYKKVWSSLSTFSVRPYFFVTRIFFWSRVKKVKFYCRTSFKILLFFTLRWKGLWSCKKVWSSLSTFSVRPYFFATRIFFWSRVKKSKILLQDQF